MAAPKPNYRCVKCEKIAGEICDHCGWSSKENRYMWEHIEKPKPRNKFYWGEE